jgi:hypothetical protein
MLSGAIEPIRCTSHSARQHLRRDVDLPATALHRRLLASRAHVHGELVFRASARLARPVRLERGIAQGLDEVTVVQPAAVLVGEERPDRAPLRIGFGRDQRRDVLRREVRPRRGGRQVTGLAPAHQLLDLAQVLVDRRVPPRNLRVCHRDAADHAHGRE